MMIQIKQVIAEQIASILDVSHDISLQSISYSKEPAFGDLSVACFEFSKILRKSPVEIATLIEQRLSHIYIQKIDIIGNYVNIFLNIPAIVQQYSQQNPDWSDISRLTQSKKIVIEFCSPNTNKPLHLGHLRNIIIGESLARTYQKLGYEVVRTSIINDRGIAIVKTLVSYEKFHKDQTPELVQKKSDHFVGDLYVDFDKHKSAELHQEAQTMLQLWEQGNSNVLELWKRLRAWALEGQNITYKKLNIQFDEELYESDIYVQGKDIIGEGLNNGIFKKHHDGHIYADLSSYNLPNKVLLRSDGTALYITQDLALVKKRLEDSSSKCYGFDQMAYITGLEQNSNFERFFAIIDLLGISTKKLSHIGYGMVRLPDGRMKSREGNLVDIDNFIQDLEHEAQRQYTTIIQEPISPEEINFRSQKIARAAYTFYLLLPSFKKDITFNIQDALSFNGKTGPYLLYTLARIQSIFSLYQKDNMSTIDNSYLNAIAFDNLDSEREIITPLLKFEEILHTIIETKDVSELAKYAYSIAAEVNSYYHSHSVLKAETELLTRQRLFVLRKVQEVLSEVLRLMNISGLERM